MKIRIRITGQMLSGVEGELWLCDIEAESSDMVNDIVIAIQRATNKTVSAYKKFKTISDILNQLRISIDAKR